MRGRVGDHDLVIPALKARGVELDFWKIAMRPGKPMIFGHRSSQLVLGLPGNPVSSMICARVFAVPLIARMLGHEDARAHSATAPVAQALSANGPRTHYMRARIGGDGRVTPIESQDSSLIAPLARADCLIVRPAGSPALAEGTQVQVLTLDF